jgi:lipopolysaccharide transport system ATP-binding protein
VINDDEAAVSVSHLSKKYRIRQRGDEPATAAEAALGLLRGRTKAKYFNAVDDVSFEIAWGDIVGLIGRNGAGKSTLLKVLTRITAPSSGRAVLGGRVGSLLEVGTGFHPELTGRENVYLNGTLLGMRRKEIERRFDEIVDFAGVESFLDTQVKRFSTGMYVRLAFGVAAHLQSEILMVDEVLAVGDAEFQEKCLGKMREVAKSGRCVFLVSHQVQTVRALATRSLYLQHGQLIYDGTVDGALEVYKASFERVGNDDVIEAAMRQGTGEVRFANARSVKDSFDAAEEKVLEFVTVPSPQLSSKHHVRCDVLDANREIVARCDSRLVEFFVDPRNEVHGTVSLRTPWLRPGVYSVDLSLWGSRVAADIWEGACSFRVLPILPYSGAGTPAATNGAPVLADFTYSQK